MRARELVSDIRERTGRLRRPGKNRMSHRSRLACCWALWRHPPVHRRLYGQFLSECIWSRYVRLEGRSPAVCDEKTELEARKRNTSPLRPAQLGADEAELLYGLRAELRTTSLLNKERLIDVEAKASRAFFHSVDSNVRHTMTNTSCGGESYHFSLRLQYRSLS